ncbi:hypothetical protein [Dermacoccus sp. UBA1591]|nr:hypothetical protein [Dermacoccus sp. UBA1591]
MQYRAFTTQDQRLHRPRLTHVAEHVADQHLTLELGQQPQGVHHRLGPRHSSLRHHAEDGRRRTITAQP